MNKTMVGLARLALPKRVRARLYGFYLDRRIERLRSRRFLEEVIVPALVCAGCATALFVGVRGYNRKCLQKCHDGGMIVWTIDVDPDAARWGAGDRHIVGDVCLIDRLMPAQTFDAVIINGVFGYGIDGAHRTETFLTAVAKTMEPHGILVVGGQSLAYRESESIQKNFLASGLGELPSRNGFPPDGIQAEHHCYDIYRLRHSRERSIGCR